MTTQVMHREFANPFSFSIVRALALLLGLLALVGLIYLGQSSQATLTGQRAQDLQEQLERLQRENTQLEYEIATLAAPDKIAARARALGLHPPTLAQTVFVTVKNYPATPKAAPASNPPLTPAPSADSFIAALWNELLARLGLAPSAPTVQAMTNP